MHENFIPLYDQRIQTKILGIFDDEYKIWFCINLLVYTFILSIFCFFGKLLGKTVWRLLHVMQRTFVWLKSDKQVPFETDNFSQSFSLNLLWKCEIIREILATWNIHNWARGPLNIIINTSFYEENKLNTCSKLVDISCIVYATIIAVIAKHLFAFIIIIK